MLQQQPIIETTITEKTTTTKQKLHCPRYFTKGMPLFEPGAVFKTCEWSKRDARIVAADGTIVFEQKDVEAPTFWSDQAVNIVAQKYFTGKHGTENRETSVKQLIGRVVATICMWAEEQGYFKEQTDVLVFMDELTYLLLYQKAAFNSPVWFNIGVDNALQQASACFILSVDDDMDSILEWYKEEGLVFKSGSGAGVNLSRLRGSCERLSGGGVASGPVSFMRGADASAGTIKSGGRTRRAAKMVILDADHPDIEEFISCKAHEEDKARALTAAGFDVRMSGCDETTLQFQNANNSVRVTDDFMRKTGGKNGLDTEWCLYARKEDYITDAEGKGHPYYEKSLDASKLFDKISDAAWRCGDPGLQFDTTINQWHTCSNDGCINASNPCSEYMFLDNTACNLASLNLCAFQLPDGELDVSAFEAATKIMFLAMDVLISKAHYPTKKIADNSNAYRTLGLGYTNLGAYLMRQGLAYDSDEARIEASLVTALMQGYCAEISATMARATAPFPRWEANAEQMEQVMQMHFDVATGLADRITNGSVPPLAQTVVSVWERALEAGALHGYRNAQFTVLAPAGTISFMMDCDTTGIEPELALVKHKKLSGGGALRLVNKSVAGGLQRLKYNPPVIAAIVHHIEENGTAVGSHVSERDLAVFDTALPVAGRMLRWQAHVDMMAAVQPFISGAISKTVNLASDCTVADIRAAYLYAWKQGLKAIAVYRDGCKNSQPLTVVEEKVEAATTCAPLKTRHALPDERSAVTHKFSIGGHEGYLTIGLYEDGVPGEMFIRMAKEGSTISGLLDSFACAVSIGLQHGVPLDLLVDKFSHSRFEPSGFSSNSDIGYAKSIMDYIFRWLGKKYCNRKVEPSKEDNGTQLTETKPDPKLMSDAPPCHDCGSLMVRRGSCYACDNCGMTNGCS